MIKIAIFASGSGSNAENIIRYFANDDMVCVDCVLSNRLDAFVHERAKKLGVPSVYFPKRFFDDGSVTAFLQARGIGFVVLAGYMLKVCDGLIEAFPNKIVNIHPALLPKFGGKGMHGSHVHEAVVAAGEKESGITIHYINNEYDAGQIIFQAHCAVAPTDTPDDVAAKVHELEYRWFPSVIDCLLKQKPMVHEND